jgi:hypothetical protein
MADQERRMAEQDRKLADQDRKMAESDRSKSDDKQRSSDKQSEQEKRIAQLEQNLSEANRSKKDEGSQSSDDRDAQDQRIAKLELSLADAKKPVEPGAPPGGGWTPPKKEAPAEEKVERFESFEEDPDILEDDLGDAEDDTFEDDAEDDIPGPVSSNGRGEKADEKREPSKKSKAKVDDDESREPARRRRKITEPEDDLPETIKGSQSDYVEHEPEPNGYDGSGSSVFDEYFELMEIAESPQLPGLAPSGATLDLNLVASLVRWASIAKHQVGEERLSGILDLYFQSRSISPSLKDLLNQIAEMADALPRDEDQTAQICVDLISHLHGILTGGMPVGQVSQVVLPARG